MKLYTNTFDLATPSLKRFWVPPYSDFMIGVKLTVNGETTDKTFTLVNGGTELEPAAEINGFAVYEVSSEDSGSKEYKIVVDGTPETLRLVQITTDSTVYDIA
ncbi:hypothetical protein [Fibrobacter sp.]|uniref:hypothetical protein n=1 Tax=Fibrobacter sp. TaxID=35828 RepID=UPI00388E7FBF